MRIRPVTVATVLTILLLASSAGASLRDYFVGTEWLASCKNPVAIMDVRMMPLYLFGHIDGALHVDKSEFLQTRRGVKSLVPDRASMAELLDTYGITQDTTVVAYAEDKNPYAARLVWTLRYHGHPKAYVLDGGYEKWAAEGRATSSLPTLATASSGYAVVGGEDVRAEADQVLTRVANPDVVVWDTRRPTEYEGTEVRADRGGHIPHATHLNWTELQTVVDGIHVLKREPELLALLARRGITPDKEIIPHCQTGIRSSYATLVLLGLGYPRVRNYDGSWIEWANDESFPIEIPALALH